MREVVERFGVTRVVGMGSVPMAVPHTRPIAITHHANRPELLTGESPWRGELRIPSSAQALLEVRLGEWGHDALGFVAHIPHYLAQLDYPRAAAALLEQVELAGRLTIDLTDLRAQAEEREQEIARYLAANEEVEEVVRSLEQQYDAFQRAEESGSSLLAGDEPLPTGEEIGQQFEQFLAGLEGPDEQQRRSSDEPKQWTNLVGLLDLEYLDVDLFRGRQPDSERQRVYGGQVAAQALVAAVRTVDPEFHVHSLHSYFLLPGDYKVPIIYDVERVRDGRSFATRRVLARQHGRPSTTRPLNFQRLEEGLEHQDAMPEVGGPEAGASMFDLMRERGAEDAAALGKEWAAIDVRFLGNSRYGLEKDPDAPVAGPGLDPDRRRAQRRPGRAPRAVHLRQRRQPARRRAGCARGRPHQHADGLARPHHLVPPAVPRRRVVALRPVVAVGHRRPRPLARPGLHRGRHPRRDRRAGGPDQARKH